MRLFTGSHTSAQTATRHEHTRSSPRPCTRGAHTLPSMMSGPASAPHFLPPRSPVLSHAPATPATFLPPPHAVPSAERVVRSIFTIARLRVFHFPRAGCSQDGAKQGSTGPRSHSAGQVPCYSCCEHKVWRQTQGKGPPLGRQGASGTGGYREPLCRSHGAQGTRDRAAKGGIHMGECGYWASVLDPPSPPHPAGGVLGCVTGCRSPYTVLSRLSENDTEGLQCRQPCRPSSQLVPFQLQDPKGRH